MLVEHLLSVGYTRVDVVEMPGQVTLRGGILDVYSPEMDRPVRVEFFGDEIESMRRFDPETQRSASMLNEALLLPLTETPVTEKILAAINARLGVLRASSSCGRTRQSHTARPAWASDARLRRRAGDGEEPGRALVEQGRAAARTIGHWIAGAARRHLRLAVGSGRSAAQLLRL
jgi:hypothetical protein